MNGLKLTSCDVGNAHPEAHTSEKVCVCAGPEFGPLEGHLLVIEKALCGPCTSGARFHAMFADALRLLGFAPVFADPSVWTRDAGDCCECVVACVDNTLTVLMDPDSFCKESNSGPWNHNLKNVEESKHHLCGNSSCVAALKPA